MVPAVEPRTRSGQNAGQLHGEPMSGLISPLGAHYSHELVRDLRSVHTLETEI